MSGEHKQIVDVTLNWAPHHSILMPLFLLITSSYLFPPPLPVPKPKVLGYFWSTSFHSWKSGPRIAVKPTCKLHAFQLPSKNIELWQYHITLYSHSKLLVCINIIYDICYAHMQCSPHEGGVRDLALHWESSPHRREEVWPPALRPRDLIPTPQSVPVSHLLKTLTLLCVQLQTVNTVMMHIFNWELCEIIKQFNIAVEVRRFVITFLLQHIAWSNHKFW